MSLASLESHRENVAKELLSTERTYVEQLLILKTVFHEPLLKSLESQQQQQQQQQQHQQLQNQPILSRKVLNLIFSNLDDIIRLNKEILSQIKARIEVDWEKNSRCLGDIFIKIIPFLKLYSIYISNFENAQSLIIEQTKNNQQFNEFLKKCSSMSELKGLRFEAYLITPVQRIPRYKLLLQDLLKHTPTHHPDYHNLEKAHQAIAEVASFVNQTIKNQEHTEKLIAIEKSFSGFQGTILVPGRKLIKEGQLTKICRKTTKIRIFFLFSDCLIYGSINQGPSSYSYHRTLMIDQIKVFERDDTEEIKNAFVITSPRKSFTVLAESLESKESWLKSLNETIESRAKNMSTLKVEGFSSTEKQKLREKFIAPVWVPDKQAPTCMLCKSDFSVVRRRHHCRCCGRVACSSCSPLRTIPWLSDRSIRVCSDCYPSVSAPPKAPQEEKEMKKKVLPAREMSSSDDDDEVTNNNNRPSRSFRTDSPYRIISSEEQLQKAISSLKSIRKSISSPILISQSSELVEEENESEKETEAETDNQVKQRSQYSNTQPFYLMNYKGENFNPANCILRKYGYGFKRGAINKAFQKRWFALIQYKGASVSCVSAKIWYFREDQESFFTSSLSQSGIQTQVQPSTLLLPQTTSTPPSGFISLDNCMTVEKKDFDSQNQVHLIRLTTTSRVFHIGFAEQSVRDSWVECIEKVCQEMLSPIIVDSDLYKTIYQENKQEEILKSGYITKQGFSYKSWKKRWFILTSDRIRYYKNPNDKEPLGEIELSQVECAKDGFYKTKIENSMAIVTPNRTYVAYLDSKLERDDWIFTINQNCKPSLPW